MSWTNVVCLFCLWNRPVRSLGPGGGELPFKDITWDPADTPVIQIREVAPGPGRGHKREATGGFRTLGELTLAQALEDPAYSALALYMKDRLIAIVRALISAGVVDPSELLS